jgi:hypothetical protein
MILNIQTIKQGAPEERNYGRKNNEHTKQRAPEEQN